MRSARLRRPTLRSFVLRPDLNRRKAAARCPTSFGSALDAVFAETPSGGRTSGAADG